ncbi:559_t:CDS:2, partial [Racocetra fulgida]
QERPKFNKLILSDIAIHLVFTSIHTGQIRNLIGIAPFAGIDVNELNAQQLMNHYKIPVAGGDTMMTPLLSKMGLNFYLVRICDKDLAKKIQDDVTPADILKNLEKLDNPELKDNFDILATYYGEISCDNTDEQNVCMLPEEDEINTNIFDIANFALIMIVDYMQDPRYITDLNSYFLGQQFLFNAGQTDEKMLPPPQAKQPEQTLASDLFNQLKKEIEETQRSNTIKLINNGNLDNKIKNTKLSSNQTEELQKLRLSKLDKLCLKQYNTIDNAKYLNNNQKTELYRLRNSQKWEIQGSKKFEQYKSEIENEAIISNLLDRKSYDILISNDSLLTEQQKNQLYTLRKQKIQILTNSLFDELKDNIKNECVLSKLEDKGYYDNRINEIQDELYDVNSELIDTIQDLNELGDNSDLANDILKLNQTLLTGDRNI